MASSDSGDAFRKRSGIEQGLILHCVSIDRATRNVKCKWESINWWDLLIKATSSKDSKDVGACIADPKDVKNLMLGVVFVV